MEYFVPKSLFGIVGKPLGHSLSPDVHNYSFSYHGLPSTYYSWEIEPGELAQFVDSLRLLPISGLSVTIPYKEPIMDLVDLVSERAKKIGSVNTLYWDSRRLVGENTDIIGFLAPLRSKTVKSAVVIGAGGAARAAIIGLLEFDGMEKVYITNRNEDKVQRILQEMDDVRLEQLDWRGRFDAKADVLVNTTPLGMKGRFQNETPWQSDAYQKGAIVYDLVYNPEATRFLMEARKAGCEIISGLEMFLHQAVEQFYLWTGKEMPKPDVRNLIKAKLQ